jgi:hypothetical protein
MGIQAVANTVVHLLPLRDDASHTTQDMKSQSSRNLQNNTSIQVQYEFRVQVYLSDEFMDHYKYKKIPPNHPQPNPHNVILRD